MLTRYTGSRVDFPGVFGVAHTYTTVDRLHSFYVFGNSYIINVQVTPVSSKAEILADSSGNLGFLCQLISSGEQGIQEAISRQ